MMWWCIFFNFLTKVWSLGQDELRFCFLRRSNGFQTVTVTV